MRTVTDYTLSSPVEDLTAHTYFEAVLLGFTVGLTSPFIQLHLVIVL